MFFKQYNYKPRSNSQSSTGSDSRERAAAAAAVAGSPPKETNTQSTTQQNKSGPVTAGIAGRRRSSAAGAEKFSGLHGHKRNSQDVAASERKANWAEQKSGQGGVLSGMWTNFTKGK